MIHRSSAQVSNPNPLFLGGKDVSHRELEGSYANNKTCAVSSTGTGEEFIRHVVAYDISAAMEYRGLSLSEAANFVVHEKLAKVLS